MLLSCRKKEALLWLAVKLHPRWFYIRFVKFSGKTPFSPVDSFIPNNHPSSWKRNAKRPMSNKKAFQLNVTHPLIDSTGSQWTSLKMSGWEAQVSVQWDPSYTNLAMSGEGLGRGPVGGNEVRMGGPSVRGLGSSTETSTVHRETQLETLPSSNFVGGQ